MAKNDIVLLDKVLTAQRAEAPAHLKDDEYFDLFSAEQLLKDLDLSTDELLEGHTGGGKDGGLDALYAFEDGKLLDEDTDHAGAKKGVELALFLLQSKRSESFAEKPIQVVGDTLEDLLDLAKDRDELEATGLYSAHLLARAEIFRTALTTLANRRPTVRIVFAYATKGDTGAIADGVRKRASRLEKKINGLISDAEVEVTFLGAKELRRLSQQEPSQVLPLAFENSLPDEDNSYVALVSLKDYFNFMRDNGSLRRYVFEGNVRDFEGEVEVNREIRTSLEDSGAPQFWWLNNGVTILCSGVTSRGKTFHIEDPQIVNGLQTSMVIFDHFSSGKKKSGTRRLLVRIVQADNQTTRDRIIRSTNRQTRVPDASLRATDEFQRDIETYFVHEGWFYDRRKNYWKNQRKPADRIIQIPYLAQAVMAAVLGDPASARARPSSLIKDDKDYQRVFDGSRPIEVYLWAARAQKAADAFLRSDQASANSEERANLRFHLTTVAVAQSLGHRVFNASQVTPLTGTEFTEDDLAAALVKLREAVAAHQEQSGLALDRVAKSSEFVKFLLDRHFPISKKMKASAAGST